MSETGVSPLEALHAAVQAFSNSLCTEPGDHGLVRQAVIVWDEVSLSEDGETSEATYYAASGDGASAVGTLGLLCWGKQRVTADLGLYLDRD